MKTWQAILCHAGVGAIQAVIGDPTSSKALDPFLAGGLQIALMGLQIYVAKVNSESNPDGTPVRKFDPNILADIKKRQEELGNPDWPGRVNE